MSDYGSPPPAGEGPYGGQPPYGAPPPQPPYGGEQPPYGAQPPQYGAPQQPPAYGAPQQPPAYGAPPPQPYGAAPLYGAAPAYAGPQGGAGMPGGATPASMGLRLGARLIDGLILGVPFMILYFGLTAALGSNDVTGSSVSFGLSGAPAGLFYLVSIAASVGYEVGLISSRGATLGKQVLGIKVVSETGQNPAVGAAALRWLIPNAASLVCCGGLLVYVSPFFDGTKRYQGWHDKVAKTFVVGR
jgi:uncharacterized RDD family membrane protein YckC